MMKEWYTTQELANLNSSELPKTAAGVYLKANRENWEFRQRIGRGGGKEYHASSLPEVARIELIERQIDHGPMKQLPTDGSHNVTVAKAPENISDEERRNAKIVIVKLFDKFRNTSCLSISEAEKQFLSFYQAEQYLVQPKVIPAWVFAVYPKFSVQTLRRWRSLRQKDDALKKLAGQYGNRKGSGIIERAENGELKTYLVALMLKQPHLTGGHLRDLCRAKFGNTVFVKNNKTGENEEKELPKIRTIERFVVAWKKDNAEIHLKITNPDAHKNKYQLALGRADDGVERLNQLWEIDASPADILCEDGRYTLYSIIDVWSRRLMFTVSKTASTEASLLIMRRAIQEWGVPEVLRTDNGSDFTSHQFTNALISLGIEQYLCDPYAGEQKPFVERSFRTLQHDLMPLLPGYIGHSVADRKQIQARKAFAQRLGEKVDKAFCVELSHHDLQEKIDAWTANKYQHKPHSGLNGISPFNKISSWTLPVKRIENERALDLLLAPIAGQDGMRTVGKKGIRYDSGRFWDSGLVPFVGQRVFVRCDPEDMGVIYCFTEDKEFICEATDFNSLGANRVHASAAAKKARKDYEKEQLGEIKKEINKITPRKMAEDIAGLYSSDNAHLVSFPKQTTTHTTSDIEQADRAVSKTDLTPKDIDGGRRMEKFTTEIVDHQTLKLQDEARWFKRAMKLEALLEEQKALDSEDQDWLNIAQKSFWYISNKNFQTMRRGADKPSHQPEPKN